MQHLIESHNIEAVVGLGINGQRNCILSFEELPDVQQDFLRYLISNQASVGCRGIETQLFLESLGFNKENLYLTGCPSLQLINKFPYNLPKEFSQLLVTGALIKRLDLVESMTTKSSKILFIPQTFDSYERGLAAQKLDNRIEIFLPDSLESWITKIRTFRPELALGTRFTGTWRPRHKGFQAFL
jgi:hypothetical protein